MAEEKAILLCMKNGQEWTKKELMDDVGYRLNTKLDKLISQLCAPS